MKKLVIGWFRDSWATEWEEVICPHCDWILCNEKDFKLGVQCKRCNAKVFEVEEEEVNNATQN